MDMPKLLIANYNIAFCKQAAQLLQDFAQVAYCHCGTQTLAMLDSLQPDMLLLDLMLPELDGLAVLQQISSRPNCPKIIVTTSLKNDYILHHLGQFPISYILPHPVDPQSLTFHVRNLSETDTTMLVGLQHAPVDNQTAFSSLLLRLGMRAKWDGFNYLLEGMPLYLRDPHQSITKELYHDIGKRFGKTGKVVEHAIRTAIKSAYSAGDPDVWRQYFPADTEGKLHGPSNKVFFAHMAQFFQAAHGTKVG